MQRAAPADFVLALFAVLGASCAKPILPRVLSADAGASCAAGSVPFVAGWYVDSLTNAPLVLTCHDGGTVTFPDGGGPFDLVQDGGLLLLGSDYATGTLCPDGTATFQPAAVSPLRPDTSSDPGFVVRSGSFHTTEPGSYDGTFAYRSDDGNCAGSVPEHWSEVPPPSDGGPDAGVDAGESDGGAEDAG